MGPTIVGRPPDRATVEARNPLADEATFAIPDGHVKHDRVRLLCRECRLPSDFARSIRPLGTVAKGIGDARGLDGRFYHVSVDDLCERCKVRGEFGGVALRLGRGIHREVLAHAVKKLEGQGRPAALLEADHLQRLLDAFGGSTWISRADVEHHPSYKHASHVIDAAPADVDPDAPVPTGILRFVSPPPGSASGLTVAGIPDMWAAVDRVAHASWGIVGPEVAEANAKALEHGDGVLRGLYPVASLRPVQGPPSRLAVKVAVVLVPERVAETYVAPATLTAPYEQSPPPA